MATPKPMLAKAADNVPDDPNWIAETKLDGWRATFDDGFRTRTGKSITQVPYLAEAISRALEGLPDGTILDGEIVDLAGHASRQWNRTQSILGSDAPHVPTPDNPELSYVVFDIIGASTLGEPLSARKKMIPLMVKLIGSPHISAVEHWPCDGNIESVYERLLAEGWEGVVCKRLDSRYQPGTRSPDWLKIKPEHELDVICTGTYPPAPGSKYDGNAVGGITFRYTVADAVGPNGARAAAPLEYEGRCAGMDDELRTKLHVDPEPFIGKVVEIAYASISDVGAPRFPRFKRFRDEGDKAVTEVAPQANVSNSIAGQMLLERAINAEAERDKLKEENKGLKERLRALFGDDAVEPEPEKGPTARERTRTRAESEELAETGRILEPTPKPARKRSTQAGKRKMRNYNAMGDPKLAASVRSLRAGTGEAYEKARADEAEGLFTVVEHLTAAEAAARKHGLAI